MDTLEVIFALRSQSKLLREMCPCIAGWTGAHEGYRRPRKQVDGLKRKPSKDIAVISDSEAGNTESADKNSNCA